MINSKKMKHSIPRKILLIGASTGGPGQIEKIIKELSILNDSAIVIAQHMTSGFMSSFSKQLQTYSENTISVAQNNEYLQVGKIYTCCGDIKLEKDNQGIFFIKKELLHMTDFNPDINKVFNSFVNISENIEIFCVILTGIGRDGVDACQALSLKGHYTLTESENSAIVDGMPSRARAEVKDIHIMDIENITKKIKEFCL
ncbi:chemotaxis protein CheB [Sulfurimonas sp.]|uniref:chemotaxis protein CheB n=1 Tax=Sulfurimonas sp. TaxID=2022749 RepID=UPI002B468410|nr:chemotaxis protein CheB [Sulfurimonas sp.]